MKFVRYNFGMAGRNNLTVPSGPGGMSGGMSDPSNQPMDLVQKNTVNRSAEPGGIVKAGGGTTLVHYTASGVAQILTTSGTTHVVTTKPVSRGDGSNVNIGSGQTVTLVSRTGPNAALNLAPGGNSGSTQPGSVGNSTLRTIPQPQCNQSTTITPYGHHIPRGAAQVANISAPRSQSVATPILRTPGQPPGTAGRGGLVSQRVVSTPGGWGRGSPSPAHSGKMIGQQQGIIPGGRGTTVGGPRATQPPPSITTYHAGVRGNSGSIRAASNTMRGVDGSNPRGPQPKALHIAQTQKYGLVGGNNRVVTTIGSSGGVSGAATGVYASGPQLVTPTLSSGTTITSAGPGPMRAPAPPTIAVRITTAPVPTATSTSQVTSQAGGGTISGMMTTSSGATMISHHPSTTMSHRNMDPHTTFKTSPIVRAPVTHHSHNKTNMTSFSGGPKVITEPAQPPSLTLSQISGLGLTGVTAQKTAVNAHTVSHSHANVIPRTGSNVVPTTVGRLNIPNAGGAIPVAKVLPQQQHQGIDRSLSSSVSISGPVPPSSIVSLGGGGHHHHHQQQQQHTMVAANNTQEQQQQGHHQPPPHTSVFLHRAHAGVSVTSGISVSGGEQRVVTTVPQYTGITTTPYFFDQNASGGPTLVPHGAGSNQYSAVRGGPTGMSVSVSNAVTVTAVPTGGLIDATSHTQGNNGGGSSAAGGAGASNIKPTASPRPSILRKRSDKYENDGSPLKAARNLSAALVAMPSPPSPKRPDSRGNGNASSGSTTISANSSPGLQIEEMDAHGVGHNHAGSNNSNVMGMSIGHGGLGRRSPPNIKQEPPDEATTMMLPVSSAGHPQPPHLTHHMSLGSHRIPSDGSSTFQATSATTTLTVPTPQLSAAAAALADGLSPRKKPRKQQLMGNELQEARSSEDDIDHPPLKKNKRDMDHINQDGCMSDEDLADGWEEEIGHSRGHSRSGGGSNNNDRHNSSNADRPANGIVLLTNRPQMSLINSVRQNWKPRHNHFARHSDVRPKDEKKQTVNEIANQKLALQRVNGWKVVHLGGQVEDLVDLESEVVDQLQMLLSSLEKRTHHRKPYKEFDKDVNRLSELVKANVQRSKIIKDQMTEARTQMHKLFDHKTKIVDIMTKYGSKRSLRKKEKT
ncbi:unnamed protein product [Meganyctiphanes norvegica]|uniref:Histone deacetylase complex subunit SAP130 C-terminal domain-containing protein n=1 Tax=Meganyctiphanes norvegica TaxID=48144 RepID=A0AAV2QHF2_MEGNR